MTKKQFARACAFVLVFALLLVALCDLFELEKTEIYDQRMYTYRQYPEDMIDAVFIGTSGVDRYIIGPKAYDEYGMTVYPLATDAMPTWLFTNVIDEALTYQNPQLFIIDARAFGQENKVDTMEVRARRLLDSMQFMSKNWFKTVRKTVDTICSVDETQSKWGVSYYLPFVKYHTKWADEDYSIHNNAGSWFHEYGGFFMYEGLSVKALKQPQPHYDETLRTELDPISEQALYDLIAYSKEKNIELLFVDTPQIMDDVEIGKANTMYDILEKEGMKYVSYISGAEKEMGLDRKTDFYNSGHVNYYGAEKFTTVFAKYLDENYDLPDRRDDEHVKEQWDGVYDHIKDTIKVYEEKKAQKEAEEAAAQ